MTVFDEFFSYTMPQYLLALLVFAFENLSQFEDRNWRLMAAFILEMVIRTVMYDGATVSNLEDTIADLKSLHGRLTRRCRTLKDQHAQAVGMARIEIFQLLFRLAHQEKQFLREAGEAKSMLSEKVETCLSILSELIKLAEGESVNQ
jgi:hypothetical protein